MKTRSVRVSAAALFIAAAPLVASANPVQWKIEDGGNGHYYEVIPVAGITWEAANAAAAASSHEGGTGYLVTITSALEDAFVADLITIGEVWAGGKQDPAVSDPTANWVWVNGEGSFPGVNGGTGYVNTYSNWSDFEPNDEGGGEQYLGIGWTDDKKWNDEGALGNIKGYVVEYEAGTARVLPGEDVQVFNEVGKQGSPNPLTASYQKVLDGGAVTISCCVVEDTREGPNGYQPNPFDIGLALADTTGNPSCEDMPEIDQGAAMLHKWQRGVPRPESAAGEPEHPLGVCVLESEVESEGIMFTAEDAFNVLGYDLDCAAQDVSDRPFTGTVHLDPTEVDAPYVVRRSADCDGSRSGFRASTNVIVLNLRHDTAQMATNPYLSKDASALKASIDAIKAEGCVDPAFLETLAVKVQSAKKAMQKAATGKGLPGTADSAVTTLDEATKMALLIGVVGDDPYEGCGANPKGLLVSRLMALKFAACSELQHPDTHSSSTAVADGTPNCVIDEEIWCALPTLPGQYRSSVGGESEIVDCSPSP